MAIDEYLFNLCHRHKQGFFRLYSWDKPSFSFGVSQKISRAIAVDYITGQGYAYVRRLTGGKTVLHHHEITYAVVSSEDIFFKEHDLYQSYMLISRVLVNAFNKLGIDAYLSTGSPAHLSRSHNPCFSFPTTHEIEIDGKKIVGSAQKRDRQALLQHGSIPISMDYDLYARGTQTAGDILKSKMTTLSDVCRHTPEQLASALIQGFQEFIGSPFEAQCPSFEDPEVSSLEEKYSSHSWNFSR